jgi:hypothetical protein
MSILKQSLSILFVSLLIGPCTVQGWFWDGYVVNVCNEQPVQQMFCASGNLYAISNGQIYYGPNCGSLGVNQSLLFDRVIDTNGLVESAFYDKHNHLYLLKVNALFEISG